MAYRVELTARAGRNLRRIYRSIHADDSAQAHAWFNGLERAVLSLDEHPSRCPPTPEDATLRHLLYGAKPDTYRIIFRIDERSLAVAVLHIRHGARKPMRVREPKMSSGFQI
jgi:plasmid stabilization system protein ParE